jgi:hypothetical protein
MPDQPSPADLADDPGGPPPVTTTGPTHRAASRLLRHDRRLLAFPALAAVGSVALLPAAAWLGAHLVRLAVEALLAAGAADLVPAGWDYPPALVLLAVAFLLATASMLAVATAVVAWCNLGLAAATDALRRGERPSLSHAVAAATWRLPHALVVGVLVGGTLLVPWLAERSTRDRHRWRFARLFGGTYSAARVLAGPAAVLDGASPVGMFRRSHALLAARFDTPVMVRIGAVQRYGAMGFAASLAALVATTVLALLTGASPSAWLDRAPVAVAVASPLWVGVVYGSAVGAVLETLLYVALREGHDRVPLVDVPVDDAVGTISRSD